MKTYSLLPTVLAAVGLSLSGALPCPAARSGELLEARDFRLTKDGRDQVVFSVAEAGTLVVKARVREPIASTPVQLLLEGPGGLRVEKIGPAPLRLRYSIAPAVAGTETWRASVINVSKIPSVIGKLTVEIQPARRRPQMPTGDPSRGDDGSAADATSLTDGKVSYVDHRRLRAACRNRNPDVSVQLDLEHGTGALLMRFNHVFSFAARQVSEDRIEMRGSGRHALYLDLASQAIFFASGEEGIFCHVRIYREGER